MALRDIKEGELIFENEPITVGPNQNAKSVCLGCFAEVIGKWGTLMNLSSTLFQY